MIDIISSALYIIFSIFSVILDFIFFFKVSRLKIGTKLNYFFLFSLVAFGLFTSGLGYIVDFVYAIIEAIVLWLIYRKRTNSYMIFGSLIVILNIDILFDIARLIFLNVINEIWKNKFLISWINLLMILVSYGIIVIIIKKYGDYFYNQLSGNNKQIILWLGIYLYLVNITISVIYTKTEYVPPISIFFVSFLILQTIFALGIFRLIRISQNQLLTKKEEEKLKSSQKQLEEYADYLEKSEDDLRAFRHDYRNILNSLKISAQEGNVQEVVRKLDKYTESNLNSKALLKYKDVNHINVKSVKSIIITKLAEMYSLQIPYNFECHDDISRIPDGIDELDLVRIIGITLDNAIEESKAIQKSAGDAEVQIMIYSSNPNEFEYEIRNKIRDGQISTSQIQKRGFTTKKDHQGLGLANIREMEDKYPGLSVSYVVEDGWFDFYVVIDEDEVSESND